MMSLLKMLLYVSKTKHHTVILCEYCIIWYNICQNEQRISLIKVFITTSYMIDDVIT